MAFVLFYQERTFPQLDLKKATSYCQDLENSQIAPGKEKEQKLKKTEDRMTALNKKRNKADFETALYP